MEGVQEIASIKQERSSDSLPYSSMTVSTSSLLLVPLLIGNMCIFKVLVMAAICVGASISGDQQSNESSGTMESIPKEMLSANESQSVDSFKHLNGTTKFMVNLRDEENNVVRAYASLNTSGKSVLLVYKSHSTVLVSILECTVLCTLGISTMANQGSLNTKKRS